jgi:hypothetical protein
MNKTENYSFWPYLFLILMWVLPLAALALFYGAALSIAWSDAGNATVSFRDSILLGIAPCLSLVCLLAFLYVRHAVRSTLWRVLIYILILPPPSLLSLVELCWAYQMHNG